MEREQPAVDSDIREDWKGDEAANQAAQPFVGRWNQLVSSTNWEKGRIICQWRDALRSSGAPVTECSDEAWSRRVGAITAQHVGRLRRVFQRFGSTFTSYERLYWSHFHAAMEWDDAEMWLEGAVQNRWSVSQMRQQRWEATGAVPSERPQDNEIVVCESDEDFDPEEHAVSDNRSLGRDGHVPSGPREEGPDFGDDTDSAADHTSGSLPELAAPAEQTTATTALVRPFAQLSELPEDLADAFEAFKLAILHHKLDGWQQVPREDVLAVLEALQQLALAPAEGSPID